MEFTGRPSQSVFVIASAWWVKWPLFAVAGGCCDAVKRRRLPTTALAAAGAAAVAEGVTVVLKHADGARAPAAR